MQNMMLMKYKRVALLVLHKQQRWMTTQDIAQCALKDGSLSQKEVVASSENQVEAGLSSALLTDVAQRNEKSRSFAFEATLNVFGLVEWKQPLVVNGKAVAVGGKRKVGLMNTGCTTRITNGKSSSTVYIYGKDPKKIKGTNGKISVAQDF